MPADSFGVMEQDALPLLPVVALHDWVPFSVSVMVCPLMPAPVTELVSVPETVVAWP